MNRKNTLYTAVFLAAGAFAAAVTGCELIATVDRTMINGTGGGGTSSATGTGGAASSTTASTGSGGTTTSSTGTGGTPCTGGVMTCSTPQDCPAPATECVIRTCDAGCCGTSNVASGVLTSAGQTGGDCMKQVCDGNGKTAMVPDDADAPDDSNACTADTCSNGAPVHTPVAGACMIGAATAVCGDPAGSAKGTCVACNTSADCTVAPNTFCTAANVCTSPSCNDNTKDGSETDKDCGGPLCGATCANTQICAGNGDCLSGFCNALVCAACTADANCTSGSFCNAGVCKVKDTVGTACTGNNQCASGACGVNGSGNCCAAGANCVTGGTCGATACAAASGACVYPTAALACGAPQSCAAGIQTNAGACSGSGTCTSGGTTSCGAFGCNAGGTACNMSCTVDGDCASGNYCSAGACLPKKPAGLTCAKNSACTSGVCDVSGSGNCCMSACNTTDATCGATACAPVTGACTYPIATTTCGGAASCSNGQTTSGGTCDGAGTCNTGAPAACPGGLICANATMCMTVCTMDSDCQQSASRYCSAGACTLKGSTGASCTADDQCLNGACLLGLDGGPPACN